MEGDSWQIIRAYKTTSVLELKYMNGLRVFRCLPYTCNKDYVSHFWKDLEESSKRRHPEVSKVEVSARNVLAFPMATEVTLCKGKATINAIVRRDRLPVLFELLETYCKALRLVSREEKYRKLYQIYEELSTEIDMELKAIRHSLSHSRRKLTDKKTTATLISMFGDVKVNLETYRHAQVFKKKLERLKQETHRLLVEEILRILPEKPNFLGVFYML